MSGAILFNAPEQTQIIQVKFPSGVTVDAEVADNPERRLIGLAFREELPLQGGLLYIFDHSAPHKVWTKGFLIPIDVVWIDESKQVVYLLKDVEPCAQDPCPWYGPPPENARYVLETHDGFIEREQVRIGTEVTFALQL